MTAIDIKHFWIEPDRGSGRPPVGYEVEEFIRQSGDYGAAIVRIGIDGDHDHVQADFAQTGDLAGLDRAITALTAVRAELAALYGTRPTRPGRCLETGEWGRCRTSQGHEGGHVFPTEADWSAEFHALSKAGR